jgi:hypothetical protein
MSNYRREMINEVAQMILAKGYRVFIAESGTHGFYTDAQGSKVIGFQHVLGGVTVSGNYKTSNPSSTGTGWQIAGCFDPAEIDNSFAAHAPHWAVGLAKWRFTTLEEHLKTYGKSSGYVELTPELTIKPYTTYRTENGKGRITYHPEWDSKQPWASYWEGTAGRHFESVDQARSYFVNKGSALNTEPEKHA